MNPEKLAKLQELARIGGKGTARRKVKKVHKPAGSALGATTQSETDKKVTAALRKLNSQMLPGIEEVNMFKDDGKVLHFAAPKGKAPFLQCFIFDDFHYINN